jgi:RNA polymerase sigma-70 factor, ECF subfamily
MRPLVVNDKSRPGGAARIPEGTGLDARHEGPLLPREEQKLMEGLLAGDDAAIRTLYARFGRPVYTMGLRLLGSREAAEELTQDVFLTAWRKGARFDPARGRLSTWLMTIAHNLAVDRLRRETGVSRPTLVLVDEVPDVLGVDEESALMERDAAMRALATLSGAERRLLVRAYFRGMTAREIAESDGIPLGTVKTRLRSALIKIRKANEGKEPL